MPRGSLLPSEGLQVELLCDEFIGVKERLVNFADTVLKPLAQFFQVGVVHSLDMFVRCRRLAWQLPSARA